MVTRRKPGRPKVGEGNNAVLHIRCPAKDKERWMKRAGGPGNISEWVRAHLDDGVTFADLPRGELRKIIKELKDLRSLVSRARWRIDHGEGHTHRFLLIEQLDAALDLLQSAQGRLKDA